MNSLASLLATSLKDEVRDGKRAVELATEACELSEYKDPNMIDTLAAAYAEAEDYDSAIKWSEKALELLNDTTKERRRPFARKLATYRARQRLPAGSGQEYVSPNVSELRASQGRVHVVHFRVQAIGGNDHRYINSRRDFRHPDCFTAVVEPIAVVEFDSKFANPEKEFLGNIAQVTGKIEARDGRVQIRIADLATQLKLLESTHSPSNVEAVGSTHNE